MSKVRLPFEIILEIIECLYAESEYSVAIPPSDPKAKNLLTLCLVSRNINAITTRLLYTRCVYLTTASSVALFRRTLDNGFLRQTNIAIKSAVIRPYHAMSRLVDDLALVANITRILRHLAPSLTTLVFDAPLRSLYPGHAQFEIIKIPLRYAFAQLIHMETFISARDELYLSLADRANPQQPGCEVYSKWPKLRQLALYNVDLYVGWEEDEISSFLCDIVPLKNLTHLVLTRPDCFYSDWAIDYARRKLSSIKSLKRITIVNYAGEDASFLPERIEDEHAETVYVAALPLGSYDEMIIDEDGTFSYYDIQKWVMERVIDGLIWRFRRKWTWQQMTIDKEEGIVRSVEEIEGGLNIIDVNGAEITEVNDNE